MNLSVLPRDENVEKLKAWGSGTAFELLYRYEANLISNESSKRALILIGDEDNKEIINKWEGLTEEDWFVIRASEPIEAIPDNYFNIIVWSGCAVEYMLKRNVLKIAYDKLIKCGRLYVLKFDQDFTKILEKCLVTDELVQIEHEQIVSEMIGHPAKITGGHLIIIKEPPKFEVDEDLLKEFRSEKLPAVVLTGYRNSKNSCFMDSILFPMLAVPNNYFDRTLFKTDKCESKLEEIKMALYEQAMSLRTTRNLKLKCVSLLKYVKELSPFLQGEQQDDSEFLISLMDIFGLKPTTIRRNRYTSDDQQNWTLSSSIVEQVPVIEFYISEDYDSRVDIIDWLQREHINNYQNVAVNDWPRGSDERPHQFSKEVEHILSSEAILFHVNRKIAGEKLNTEVRFPEYVKRSDTGDLLELSIVTIHHGSALGGHYTCYFKYDGEWFEYDDLSDERVAPSRWELVNEAGSTGNSLIVYEKLMNF